MIKLVWVVFIDGELVGLSVDLIGFCSCEVLFVEIEKVFVEWFFGYYLVFVCWFGKRLILWSRFNGDLLVFVDVR